jgi:hypothetical protein
MQHQIGVGSLKSELREEANSVDVDPEGRTVLAANFVVASE